MSKYPVVGRSERHGNQDMHRTTYAQRVYLSSHGVKDIHSWFRTHGFAIIWFIFTTIKNIYFKITLLEFEKKPTKKIRKTRSKAKLKLKNFVFKVANVIHCAHNLYQKAPPAQKIMNDCQKTEKYAHSLEWLKQYFAQIIQICCLIPRTLPYSEYFRMRPVNSRQNW